MATIYFYNAKTEYSPKNKQLISNTAKEIVKRLASRYLSVCFESIEIEKGKNGKPYIRGYDNFHFNISHSDSAIAVAVDTDEIGVDIEKLRKADFRICNRFFTEREKEYVGNSDRRFFQIWTKKEAYIKKHGLALKDLKKTCNDNIFTTEIDDFIISVSQSKNSHINIIVLENLEDL